MFLFLVFMKRNENSLVTFFFLNFEDTSSFCLFKNIQIL